MTHDWKQAMQRLSDANCQYIENADRATDCWDGWEAEDPHWDSGTSSAPLLPAQGPDVSTLGLGVRYGDHPQAPSVIHPVTPACDSQAESHSVPARCA